MTVPLLVAAQKPGAKPFDDEAIRDALEGIAVMHADNEGDPNQKDLPTLEEIFKMTMKRCDESGVDRRRFLEIAEREVDRYATLVDGTGHKAFTFNSVRLLAFMALSGDRSILPYLEAKSLNPETDKLIRSAAAEAYVKLANVDECAAFLRKLYEDPTTQGSRRYFLNKKLLGKIGAEEKMLTPETKTNIHSFLLGVVQKVDDSGEANDADRFLLDRIPEYANSRQRATLGRYANTGNAWVTNTFNPIKAHFDKIPPSKRVDLRKRFPDLPPLPKEKDDGGPLKVALGVGAGLAVLAALAAWLALLRRKPLETA